MSSSPPILMPVSCRHNAHYPRRGGVFGSRARFAYYAEQHRRRCRACRIVARNLLRRLAGALARPGMIGRAAS